MDEDQKKRNDLIERLFDRKCINVTESRLLGFRLPAEPSWEAELTKERELRQRAEEKGANSLRDAEHWRKLAAQYDTERNEANARTSAHDAERNAAAMEIRKLKQALSNEYQRATTLREQIGNLQRSHHEAEQLALENSGRAADMELRVDRAERALKRDGYEDRGGAEWVPPVIPAETKIATFPGEFVSWHDLTERARHMLNDAKVVLTAQQVRALENNMAAFTQGQSRVAVDRPACVHHVWGPNCSDCPGGKTVPVLNVTGHYTGCPKENGGCTCAKRDAAPQCAGEPDCGWHNGGPCAACKASLSARDEFAKAAMQATVLLTSSEATRLEVAQRAYAMADAMLKARGG